MLLTLNCFAQPQITWLKYFKTSTDPIRIHNIIQMDDSGFVATTSQYNPVPANIIIRLDKYGDTLWTKIGKWGYGLLKSYDTCYYVLAGTSVVKLNANFDSISSVDYSQYPFGSNIGGINLCYDSSIVLNSSSTVIKTDSLGVIQWTQSFIGTIRKVIPCKNGDILVVGYWGGYGNTYSAKLLSASGQVLWNRQHGVVEEDWGTIKEFGINDAVELPDGNFLAASGSYHPHFGDSAGWDMIKLDRATGDTLQTYVFDTITGSPEQLIYMTYTADSNIIGFWQGVLLKIKQYGSIIWYKISPINEVWDLIGCSDNGIAIAGSKYYPGNPINKSAYAKLDSLGNIYNYQGIPYIQPQLVSVYPNPASNQLTIDNLQLTNKPFTVTVYDVLGKVHLTQNTSSSAIDISTLTPGLYVLQVQQGDKMYYGKFVKE